VLIQTGTKIEKLACKLTLIISTLEKLSECD